MLFSFTAVACFGTLTRISRWYYFYYNNNIVVLVKTQVTQNYSYIYLGQPDDREKKL